MFPGYYIVVAKCKFQFFAENVSCTTGMLFIVSIVCFDFYLCKIFFL